MATNSVAACTTAACTTAMSSATSEQRRVTEDERSKKHCFHRAAAKSVFFLLLTCPSVVDESLIILVDHNITSTSYLYDSISPAVGMGDDGGGVGDGNIAKIYKN